MSAAMASSTDSDTIFVRLLDEGAVVWRPVSARRISEATYRLCDDPVPEDETWRFQPGDVVVAEHRTENGALSTELFAVAKANDFDEPATLSLAS